MALSWNICILLWYWDKGFGVNTMKLSWRDVFDSQKKFHGSIDVAYKLAKDAGYGYFCWNDWVYDTVHVLRHGTLEQLGLV